MRLNDIEQDPDDKKEKEKQKEQERIHQESHGPHSPNIVGSHNVVTSVSVNPAWGISPEQKRILSEILKPFRQSVPHISLESVFGDSNSSRLAYDLSQVLTRAGWDVPEGGHSQSIYGEYLEGVMLMHPKTGIPEILYIALVALRDCGIYTRYSNIPDPELPDNCLRIIVGHKPI